jgi:hypothetical protein
LWEARESGEGKRIRGWVDDAVKNQRRAEDEARVSKDKG